MKTLSMLLRKILLLAMLAALVATGRVAVESWDEYQMACQTQSQLNDIHSGLLFDVEQKRRELDLLDTDSTYYQQLAREEFGMVRGNEIVFIVPLEE